MDEWGKAKEYSEYIEREYYNKIRDTHNIEYLKELYRYVKKVSLELYNDSGMHPAYIQLRNQVLYAEDFFNYEYASDILPKYTYRKRIDLENTETFLESIVDLVRTKIMTNYYSKDIFMDIINKIDFVDECANASNRIKKICDKLKIECHVLTIYPGYEEKLDLFSGNGFHKFNVIKLNKTYYLVDATYRQFFELNRNLIERVGIYDLSGCKAGYFMLINDERRKVAEKLLRYGYTELDENVFKNYLDGFTMSFRNGLFYEKTNDFSFTTIYSVEDYIKFFNGEDNQANHEGIELLGYQKGILKKYDLF